jgi:aryl-alcohol dehydrogenase-like predicted oxidoreductase
VAGQRLCGTRLPGRPALPPPPEDGTSGTLASGDVLSGTVIERAVFGRTGHESSRVIFGSAGLGMVDQERADTVLPLLEQHGVNHIDTAAAYGDAELRLAPWLRGRRDRFFLATKTGDRKGPDARRSLERSLERLGVDSVDLIQLHNLVEEDEWEVAHAQGGALEALVRAREEGLASHIGVTGHGLRIAGMHLRSLARYDYDTVLLPYNYLLLRDAGYRSDVEELLGLCEERAVAVQTIKAIARRRWPHGAADNAQRFGDEILSWYEPLVDDEPIAHAVDFVLGREGLFLVTSSDFRRLDAILSAAETPNGALSQNLLAADSASFEMSPVFDGRELDRI